jgi:solute carrier family 12 sodium/potassium/chloride transporter 2
MSLSHGCHIFLPFQRRGINGNPLPTSVIDSLTRFQRKQPKGTIDIWWLYDDGGLTILLPYIISTRKTYSESKIRVFALSSKQNSMEVEEAT